MEGELAPGEQVHLDDVRRNFHTFLWEFTELVPSKPVLDDTTMDGTASGVSGGQEAEKVFKYREQARAMGDGEFLETLFVDIEDVRFFNAHLAVCIEQEWLKVEPVLRQAVQKLVLAVDPDLVKGDNDKDKEFYISWEGVRSHERLRDLRSAKVGRLLSWTGTVTRTTEVRPELYLGAFRCQKCSQLVRNVEQQFVCTYPLICPSPTCGNKNAWTLVKEESTFVDWQRAKVQENSDEVPPGSLPRTMDVIIRSELVEHLRPGDKVAFTGCLIVIPDLAAYAAPGERTLLQSKGGSSAQQVGRGVSGIHQVASRELHYKLGFLACNIKAFDKEKSQVNARTEGGETPDEVAEQLGQLVMDTLKRMQSMPDIYHKLARSLAPGVYGHEDVKKAVLLMLVGGVHKVTKDGIRLRGDINVAIVGDPSCAKSQILKYVARFLPRAIFTSGKSSSAAGLTATVVKEADSREYTIEAGALMLADNGICCIDEFDKMDIKDQVAIHEAMEQQTISIAKAGIQATLNARTSILAAANPLGGRYDRSKPLKYNVNLPPAILSRFDLLHVMVDEVNPAVDEAIAFHILAMHRGRAPEPPFPMIDVQRYIRYARSIKPRLTPEARVKLVDAFKRLRSQDAVPGSGSVYRITVRQLEALVRLSEALARLAFRFDVLPEDVAEAQRLIRASVHSAGDADMVLHHAAEDDEVDDANVNTLLSDFGLGEEGDQAMLPEGQEPAAAAAAVPGAGDENADDANANDAGEDARRVRRRTLSEINDISNQPRPADAPAPAAEAQKPPPAETRISRQRWSYLQNHVVACLKEAESKGAEGGGTAITTSAEVFVGLPQHDIIKWHIREELSKFAIETAEEVSAEYHLMKKVIHVLLTRDGVLVEMQVPPRKPDESDGDYTARRERERVLIINPNYYLE